MHRWLATSALLLFVFAAPARAEEDAAKVEEAKKLVADLAALRKAKDASGFQGLLKQAVETHTAIENGGLRGKIQKEIGAALKSKPFETAQGAVVTALSELNDPKGAFKQLRRMLPTPKDEEVGEIPLAAIKAVGVLAPEGALKSLVELGLKAKSRPASQAAIEALGHFGKSKKRVSVLEELITMINRFMPARGVQNSEDTIKRWNDLAGPLVVALNTLTGQKVGSPEEWLQLHKDNKKNLEGLFNG